VAVAKAYAGKEATADELAKVYGISPSRVYTWARIYREKGEAGLAEIKRGGSGVAKSDPIREKLAPEILRAKKEFAWFGIPRLTQWLRRTQLLPVTESQVKKTLKEADLVPKKPKKRKRAEVVRFFERAEPNQLWQTDITMWTVARGQKRGARFPHVRSKTSGRTSMAISQRTPSHCPAILTSSPIIASCVAGLA